jgi:uncharacterized protein with FMN-binding domain
MTTRPHSRILSIGVASFGLLALAGCAAESSAADPVTSDSSTSDSSTSDSSTTTSTTYADGTYTAEASYQAPSGTESVTVEITVANDVVTAVTTSSDSGDHEAREWQERFASGISAEAVGKDLASLSVSRVAGSSLTSTGFNVALDDIRSQAA